MKILVRFHDNDFGSTLRVFGELLLIRIQNDETGLTSERIADWFNRSASLLCEMTGRNRSPEDAKSLESYLKIKASDVYINEAVDEKMKTAHEWANCEAVMIDGNPYNRNAVYLV